MFQRPGALLAGRYCAVRSFIGCRDLQLSCQVDPRSRGRELPANGTTRDAAAAEVAAICAATPGCVAFSLLPCRRGRRLCARSDHPFAYELFHTVADGQDGALHPVPDTDWGLFVDTKPWPAIAPAAPAPRPAPRPPTPRVGHWDAKHVKLIWLPRRWVSNQHIVDNMPPGAPASALGLPHGTYILHRVELIPQRHHHGTFEKGRANPRPATTSTWFARACAQVGPAEWYACRPGSGPCDPKPSWPGLQHFWIRIALQMPERDPSFFLIK